MFNLDRQEVIGALRSTGSTDPDVLYAKKQELLLQSRHTKLGGTWFMILGGLLTITILGAFVGIPLLLIGWWIRHIGVRNIRTADGVLSEYVQTIRDAGAAPQATPAGTLANAAVPNA